MTKHHYLPACYIGRFSNDTNKSSRNRLVHMYSTRTKKTLHTKAQNFGYKSGLYDTENFGNIDKWDYEKQLTQVLDSISKAKNVSLDDWVHVAVPFVAGLFVRGKEFNGRYESNQVIKILQIEGKLNPDNTNIGRAMRMQRLLTPVLAARWVVMHNSSRLPLISNDLGMVLTKDAGSEQIGWAIPLDRRTLLGLFPRKTKIIAHYEKSRWYSEI